MKSGNQTFASIGLVFIALGGFLGCSGTTGNGDYSSEVAGEFKHKAEIDGVTVQLTHVKQVTGEYKGNKPKGKGYFFVAEISISNKSGDYVSFKKSEVTLKTKSGDELKTVDVQGIGVGLDDGESDVAELIYEVPVNVKPDYLVVNDKKVLDIPIRK